MKPSLGLLATLFLVGVLFILFLGSLLGLVPEPIGSRADLFAEGARTTVTLSLLAGAVGLILGTLAGLAKLSSIKPLRFLAIGYIELFRGTPLLTQILFVYFALPAMSPMFRFGDFLSAAVALSLNVGAYNAEAIRAGILSVPSVQRDAAFCLGLTPLQTMTHVIFPQGLKMAIPPLVGYFVALIKDSAMASVIGLAELTQMGNRITSETFRPIPVLLTVAAVYLVLTALASSMAAILERRLR